MKVNRPQQPAPKRKRRKVLCADELDALRNEGLHYGKLHAPPVVVTIPAHLLHAPTMRERLAGAEPAPPLPTKQRIVRVEREELPTRTICRWLSSNGCANPWHPCGHPCGGADMCRDYRVDKRWRTTITIEEERP